MAMGFYDRLIFLLRNRLGFSSCLRTLYFRFLGMKIGKNTFLPRIYCPWPHQVSLGANCQLERDIYFHFDGIWKPGPSILIGDNCFLGLGCEFNVRDRVTIGNHCLIAAGARFIDHDHNISGTGPMPNLDGLYAPIILGNDVWIGANAIILKGVEIRQGAVVAAGAVVTKKIQSNEIWGGVPARKIGERKS